MARCAYLAVACLTLALAAPGLAPADTAGAVSANLTMRSEPGEEIGQGLDYNYSTPATLVYAYSDGNLVRVLARSPDWSDWWYLDFAAPGAEQLLPGDYSDAVPPFLREAGQPGLSVAGQGRGCTLTGSFEVIEAEYGPLDMVVRFHATFEQRCAPGGPALRGEIALTNHPWRPPLEIVLTLDPQGSRRGGDATVSGTIACNAPGTSVALTVEVTQEDSHHAVYGSHRREGVACGPDPVQWSQRVESFSCRDHPLDTGTRYTCDPFTPGQAQASITAAAFDPTYQLEGELDQSLTAMVSLTRPG